MKKFLAMIISASMLLSLAVLLAVPASAVDGMWEVYGTAKEFRDDFDPEADQYSCIPGYSYVRGEGLKLTSPGWTISTPKVGIQTKEKVNLKNGVYMQVRVDEFSYDAGDKWFSFNIYDTKYVNVGSSNKEIDGEGVTTLVRPTDSKNLTAVGWYYSNFKSGGGSSVAKDFEHFDAAGNLLLALEITWSDVDGYSMSVNGAPIDDVTVAWMNEHFADGEAYVGFNMHNNKQGGTSTCTVLKYGENKATALTPMGDDSAEPVYVDDEYTPAEIADPNEVPENQPAILLNGNRLASDSKSTVKNSGITSLTEENYIHYTSDRALLRIGFGVKNSVSYDIDDFPVLVVLTKNFCTCPDDGGCSGFFESCNLFIMAGEDVSESDDRSIRDIWANKFHNDETVVVGDDTYLYFTTNVSEEASWDASGRINGIRFDIDKINITTPGRNEFDVCFAAFFRNEDEAKTYINEFLTAQGWVEEEETDAPTDTETDPQETDPQETNPQETNPQETNPQETNPQETNPQETAPQETDKQTEAGDNTGDTTSSGGCFGTVGFGAIAMITLAAGVSFVAFKKKK